MRLAVSLAFGLLLAAVVLAKAPPPTPGPPLRPASPTPSAGDESESRRIDALVAHGRIGEAHAAAMQFIERHPDGPWAAHVMNLMGVHPRPPGVLPAHQTPSVDVQP